MGGRPLIGLTSDCRTGERPLAFVYAAYTESVERAGGIPVHVPPLSDPAHGASVLDRLDGLLIVGGEDLDPRLYGEEPLPACRPVPPERQRCDVALVGELLDRDLPVLGICYGCQLLAVASGGALHQDLPSQVEGALRHGGRWPDLPRHPVEVTPGSRLHAIVGAERIEVNSAHHQAPRRVGGALRVVARAPDGVVEALEAPGERFLLGVQWHPELLPECLEHRRLFEALVEAARRWREEPRVER